MDDGGRGRIEGGEELGARDKQLVKELKKLSQADNDKAAAAAVQAAEEAAAAGDKYVVLELAAIDSKAMQPLIQKVLKKTSLPVLALSVDSPEELREATTDPERFVTRWRFRLAKKAQEVQETLRKHGLRSFQERLVGAQRARRHFPDAPEVVATGI